MEQESQHTHAIMHVSDSYKDGKWIIPEYFLIEFERRFWCKNCNLRNKYVYIDGNYKYTLERKE